MIFQVRFTSQADEDIKALKRNEPQAYKKLIKLLLELQEHPEIGTGHPKPLGGDRTGQWSRRITDKHRLVYSVDNETITVLVISAAKHYGEK